jgi:hypothetical protein
MHDACVMAEIAVASRHDGGGGGQRTACDERSVQVVLLKQVQGFFFILFPAEEDWPCRCLVA